MRSFIQMRIQFSTLLKCVWNLINAIVFDMGTAMPKWFQFKPSSINLHSSRHVHLRDDRLIHVHLSFAKQLVDNCLRRHHAIRLHVRCIDNRHKLDKRWLYNTMQLMPRLWTTCVLLMLLLFNLDWFVVDNRNKMNKKGNKSKKLLEAK